MARVEGGAVTILTDWPGLKDQIDIRNLNFRFEENSISYEVFAIDGEYFYSTTIYKAGVAPDNQATYDTYRADFEANYKNRITDITSTQPFYLSNIDGYSITLKDGATPTVNDGYGIAVIGYDGSNYRMLKSDSSGRPVLVGAGTAGAPTGGILTVQGTPTGEPIPISGNITASNASVSDNDLAIPLFSNLIGGSDGTNLRPLRVFDVDSGGGQQWVLGVGLRKASGGGSVEAGTASDPIRTDPTGTTTQPVSGTVAATQSGTWTVQPGNTANTTPWLTTISQGGNSATVTASNALKIDGSAVTQPVSGTVTVVQSTASSLRAQLASESSTGAAITATALLTGGSDGTNLRAFFVDSSGRPFVVGAAADGAAVTGNPVLIAGSDGTNARSIRTATDGTVRVDPTGTTTQPVSGTVTANAGSGTFTVAGTVAATQSGTWTVQPGNTANTTPWLATINQGGNSATVTASNALKVDGSAVTQPVSTTQLPVSLVGGRLDNNIGSWLGSTAPTVGQKNKVDSIPVVIPTDQTLTVSVVPTTASTGLIIGKAILAGGTANTLNIVRATVYNEPSTNAQRSISSASANDTSAGTGARQVEIKYYTQAMIGPFTEIVTLNGTTPVATSNSNICFIENIRVVSVGSNGSNVGIITLFVNSSGGGGTIGTIGTGNIISGIGDNTTFWGHHYVADGYTSSLATLVASATVAGANSSATFILRSKNPTSATSPNIQIGEFLSVSAAFARTLGIPIRAIGPARIEIYGIPSSNNATLNASFDFSEQ